MPLLASLSTLVQPGGTIGVPVTINGRTLSLTVDTGDVVSAISNSAADQMGLEKHSFAYTFRMLGDVQIEKKVNVDSVHIGGISAGGTVMVVIPDFAMAGSDGLLGPDFMQNFDIEFDFAHAKFNIFAPASCPGKTVYWTKDAYVEMPMHVDDNWHITVPVMLDGKPVTAIVDSGAAHSFITMGELKKYFGITLDSAELKKIGNRSINGTVEQPIYRYPFSTLTFDGVVVNNPNIEILSDETYHTPGPQMIVGASILRQLRVYISYKTKTIYATPAEAH
jgi:predicted aspartyl protease